MRIFTKKFLVRLKYSFSKGGRVQLVQSLFLYRESLRFEINDNKISNCLYLKVYCAKAITIQALTGYFVIVTGSPK